MNHFIIMAGGSGTRFWPKSRKYLPKQFLKLFSQKSLIQETVDRLLTLAGPENIIIVANKNHENHLKKQLPQIPGKNILLEPFGRNTAPCIALAALLLHERDKEAVMIVLPSDHLIKNEEAFCQNLGQMAEYASTNSTIVTIGITPTKPETGYGYIKCGEKITGNKNGDLFVAAGFTEKPQLAKAKEYLHSGDYFWNSGIFAFRADTILEEFETYLPDTMKKMDGLKKYFEKDIFPLELEKVYGNLEGISIDYGVIEKSRRVEMVKGTFYWNDVGSWSVMEEIFEKGENTNITRSELLSIDSKGNIIDLPVEKKLLAMVGIEDLIIVDTGDILLLCKKERAQEIKKILETLEKEKKNNLT